MASHKQVRDKKCLIPDFTHSSHKRARKRKTNAQQEKAALLAGSTQFMSHVGKGGHGGVGEEANKLDTLFYVPQE